MPNTYSFFGSATYSVTKDNLDELMSILPNNNSNLIDPQDLRDSVFTLWDRLDVISASVSISGSVSTDYNRTTPSTAAAVGGVSTGSTFSGTIQNALDRIFYPYIGPAASLSGGNNREFGSSNTLTLSWSVTKNSETIFSITVDGVPILPTGNSQGGSQGATATQNVNTTFNMSAADTPTGTIANASTSVTWSNRRYWGTHTTFTALNSAQILALTGAGVGSGNDLIESRVQNRNGINGAGNYLVFAWPTASNPGTPTFTINGLPSTAWTKINNAYAFTNTFGYITNYDVWISNTPQFSPLSLFQIS